MATRDSIEWKFSVAIIPCEHLSCFQCITVKTRVWYPDNYSCIPNIVFQIANNRRIVGLQQQVKMSRPFFDDFVILIQDILHCKIMRWVLLYL